MQGSERRDEVTAARYKLKHIAGDDSDVKWYFSEQPLQAGQAIEIPETGDWHLVVRVWRDAQGMKASVSEPADSPIEALNVATLYKHWK